MPTIKGQDRSKVDMTKRKVVYISPKELVELAKCRKGFERPKEIIMRLIREEVARIEG